MHRQCFSSNQARLPINSFRTWVHRRRGAALTLWGTRGTPRQAGAMDYVQKCPLLERLWILVPAGDRERIAIRLCERGLCAVRLADL